MITNKFRIWKIGAAHDIAHILIPASLDTMTAYLLRDTITALMEKGIYKYIIDLSDVEFFSSSGIEVLHDVQQRLTPHGGKVILANLPHKLVALFEMVGVMVLLLIKENVEQALRVLEPHEQ